jgi:hypothetical protein
MVPCALKVARSVNATSAAFAADDAASVMTDTAARQMIFDNFNTDAPLPKSK